MFARFAIAGSAFALATLLSGSGPAQAGQMKHESANQSSVVTTDDDAFAYVLVRKKTQTSRPGSTRTDTYATGSGERKDFEAARNQPP